MKISKKAIRNMTLAAALGGAASFAVPAIAGTVLNGATVTNAARGELQGRLFGAGHLDVVQANINLPANGGGIDWHTHPGAVVGVVTGGGTLTIVTHDCEELVYETGEAFTPPWRVHTARNFSDQPVTVRASFFLPKSPNSTTPPPPTVFVDPEYDDELDDRCGLAD